MAQLQQCKCGNTVPELTSYFPRGTSLRITLCDNCAEHLGFKNDKRFIPIPYKLLTREQKIYNTSGNQSN